MIRIEARSSFGFTIVNLNLFNQVSIVQALDLGTLGSYLNSNDCQLGESARASYLTSIN